MIWKHSRWDSLLLLYSLIQCFLMVFFLFHWADLGFFARFSSVVLMTLMMTYNIIVVSHFLTHTAWFRSPLLNTLVYLLNTLNIGQSIQAYHLTHVRNHHRYNNDRQQSNGQTMDTSSTYQGGKMGEHSSLTRYALSGACSSLQTAILTVVSLFHGGRLKKLDAPLQALISRSSERQAQEIHQLQADRVIYGLALLVCLWINWHWVIFAYLPAFFVACVLVNIQNYYEHFGAYPESIYANSVSHYGRWYNRLTFNDGYHQEHHLSPSTHWRMLPKIYQSHQLSLTNTPRIISPVPAILGFLHRSRQQLHRSEREQHD